jgi:hypothetical protein
MNENQPPTEENVPEDRESSEPEWLRDMSGDQDAPDWLRRLFDEQAGDGLPADAGLPAGDGLSADAGLPAQEPPPAAEP